MAGLKQGHGRWKHLPNPTPVICVFCIPDVSPATPIALNALKNHAIPGPSTRCSGNKQAFGGGQFCLPGVEGVEGVRLQDESGGQVRVRVPKRGVRRRAICFARSNALADRLLTIRTPSSRSSSVELLQPRQKIRSAAPPREKRSPLQFNRLELRKPQPFASLLVTRLPKRRPEMELRWINPGLPLPFLLNSGDITVLDI